MAEESLASIFDCLCGKRPERYWLEKYVALNHLFGYLLWSRPADQAARQLIRAVAASRLIVTIADERDWVRESGGPADAAAIQSAEFSSPEIFRHILDLASTNNCETQVLAAYHDAARASLILQFFFGYRVHKSARRQDRASLNKAYASIARGHFPVKVKTSRMKDLWSKYATALPLVYAMEYTGLSPQVVHPFDEDSIPVFVEEQNEKPDATKHLVEMAATIQVEFISLLDKEAKKKKWLRYPANLAYHEFENLRMTKKKVQEVRGLWRKTAKGGQS